MTTILIATRNAHKADEIRAILGRAFGFLALNDFPQAPRVLEDAATFAGNATKKAVALAKWLCAAEAVAPGEPSAPRWVLADDSGLEVEALGGAPGVHSARFAAPGAAGAGNMPDADNNAKLLRLLKEVPQEKRTARFRCVMALVPVPLGKVEAASPVCYADEFEAQTFEGVCEGRILFEPRGKNGFGYDPLFVPAGFDGTFAELGGSVKNKLSHRARALEKLKAFLTTTITGANG